MMPDWSTTKMQPATPTTNILITTMMIQPTNVSHFLPTQKMPVPSKLCLLMVHRATCPVPTHTRSSLTRPTTTTTSSLIQLLRSPPLLPELKRTSCLASVCSSISTRTLHCTRLRITRNMNSELTTTTTTSSQTFWTMRL